MNKKSDGEIKQQVLRELKWDSRIPWSEIGVEVFDGEVTLTGNVNSYAKKRAAQEAAHRIDGVLDVANEIEVRPTVNVEELREEIEDALECRADRQAERLRIEVHNGAVDLFGRVHSWQEKRAVVGSISHAPGVNEIRDHLTIDPYF